MVRRSKGSEAFHCLKEWDQGSASSERLSAVLLRVEGYQSVDPSHPLGGPDGLKDLICTRGDKKFVVGVYFPREKVRFSAIKKKFQSDLKGVESNEAEGFVFVTNQELRISERDSLQEIAKDVEIDLFHLERVSSILNTPACYGFRLEFLDIDMTKEELLAFITSREAGMIQIQKEQQEILSLLKSIKSGEMPPRNVTAQSPIRVTPQISNSMLSGSMYGEQVHRCSSCGFGYTVESPFNTGAIVLTGGMTITCPNCKNIENYTQWL